MAAGAITPQSSTNGHYGRCILFEDFLQPHTLYQDDLIWSGQLPEALRLDEASFEALWSLHPEAFHEVTIAGRRVSNPRWEQAYNKDYAYAGNTNLAQALPTQLAPFLDWSQEHIDPRLNGLLVIWYDASLGHYIGKHRDATKGLVTGAPIVTLSFGETRTFRMRPAKGTAHEVGESYVDFSLVDGTVFVIPYETNQRWYHEVPKAKKYTSRRISITMRAFQDEAQ